MSSDADGQTLEPEVAQAKISSLETRIAYLQRELSATRDQNEELETRISGVRAEMSKLTGEMKLLQAQNDRLQKQVTSLRLQKADGKTQQQIIRQLEHKVLLATTDKERAEKKVVDTTQSVADQREELQKERNMRLDLMQQLRLTKQELDKLTVEHEAISTQKAEQDGMVDKVTMQLEVVRTKLAAKDHMRKQRLLELQRQALEIRDLKAEKRGLEDDIATHKEAHQAIAVRYKRLRRAFFVLQKQLMDAKRSGVLEKSHHHTASLVSPADLEPSLLKVALDLPGETNDDFGLPSLAGFGESAATLPEAKDDELVDAVLNLGADSSLFPPAEMGASAFSSLHCPDGSAAFAPVLKPTQYRSSSASTPGTRASSPVRVPSLAKTPGKKGRRRPRTTMSTSALLNGSLYIGRGLGLKKPAHGDEEERTFNGTRGSVRHVLSELMKANPEVSRLRDRERTRLD